MALDNETTTGSETQDGASTPKRRAPRRATRGVVTTPKTTPVEPTEAAAPAESGADAVAATPTTSATDVASSPPAAAAEPAAPAKAPRKRAPRRATSTSVVTPEPAGDTAADTPAADTTAADTTSADTGAADTAPETGGSKARSAKSGTTKSGTTKAGATKSDTAKSDTAKARASRSGTARTRAAEASAAAAAAVEAGADERAAGADVTGDAVDAAAEGIAPAAPARTRAPRKSRAKAAVAPEDVSPTPATTDDGDATPSADGTTPAADEKGAASEATATKPRRSRAKKAVAPAPEPQPEEDAADETEADKTAAEQTDAEEIVEGDATEAAAEAEDAADEPASFAPSLSPFSAARSTPAPERDPEQRIDVLAAFGLGTPAPASSRRRGSARGASADQTADATAADTTTTDTAGADAVTTATPDAADTDQAPSSGRGRRGGSRRSRSGAGAGESRTEAASDVAAATGASQEGAPTQDEEGEAPRLPAAALLFQPPAARRRRRRTDDETTGSAEGAPTGEDAPADEAPAEDEAAAPRSRGRRGSRRSSRQQGEPTAEQGGATDDTGADGSGRGRSDGAREADGADTEGDLAEGVEPDEVDETDGSGNEDAGEGGGRRRRRRGGRGRKRPSGENAGDDERSGAGSDDADSSDVPDASDSSDASDHSDDGDDESGGSRRRRRRRGRRGDDGGSSAQGGAGGSAGSGSSRARDEVTALKGSTRLEAKRLRRREGRDAGRRRQIISEAEFLARRESVKRDMVVRERGGMTQIAVLEDGVLVEHYVAAEKQTSMVGNVYLGRVQNVLPSMEAAFVDLGKGRNAVLYAGEVNWEAAGLDGQPRRIEQALKSGDQVLVQVTKDPIGHKGARLTAQITLAGRYLVLVPSGAMTGISRKLPENERTRLKKLLKEIVPAGQGVIVRTAAEGASEEELRRDVERLTSEWADISARSTGKKPTAPALLKGEPELALRVVRDVFNEDFSTLTVAGDGAWETISGYVTSVAPDLAERLHHWSGGEDVFAASRVDEQLAKGMDRKVWLPSGGSLVIDRTEAMTVVDVNTGKFTGSGGTLEETVTRNNLEAAEEIVRQLRLRDIGGIIVVDFIDMVLESNRDLVLRRLIECLGRDRTRHQVAEVTSLGLVQMTRKRVGQGLVEAFSTPCEHCHGRGFTVASTPHEHVAADEVEQEENDGGSSRSSRRRGRSSSSRSGTPAATPAPAPVEVDPAAREAVKATLAQIAAAAQHAHEHADEQAGEQADEPTSSAAAAGGDAAGNEVAGDEATPIEQTEAGPAAFSPDDAAPTDDPAEVSVEVPADAPLDVASEGRSTPRPPRSSSRPRAERARSPTATRAPSPPAEQGDTGRHERPGTTADRGAGASSSTPTGVCRAGTAWWPSSVAPVRVLPCRPGSASAHVRRRVPCAAGPWTVSAASRPRAPQAAVRGERDGGRAAVGEQHGDEREHLRAVGPEQAEERRRRRREGPHEQRARPRAERRPTGGHRGAHGGLAREARQRRRLLVGQLEPRAARERLEVRVALPRGHVGRGQHHPPATAGVGEGEPPRPVLVQQPDEPGHAQVGVLRPRDPRLVPGGRPHHEEAVGQRQAQPAAPAGGVRGPPRGPWYGVAHDRGEPEQPRFRDGDQRRHQHHDLHRVAAAPGQISRGATARSHGVTGRIQPENGNPGPRSPPRQPWRSRRRAATRVGSRSRPR
ncbi:hypothetical protein GCM10025875_08550 [Litorihabitans aurantiacus]|uniref:Ribonuclease E n=1 Tax=Litorihabitans aurantiacus TaxID=1930061 RepID=A0AA37UQU1_9MICO|nr:hypothetical protein GCM10025875_08550 [Litorihabitans aurantiacus]